MNEFQKIEKKEITSHRFIAFSKLDSKGRILIPKKLRKKLDSSVFIILLNGERIELAPANKKLTARERLPKAVSPRAVLKKGGDKNG